MPEGWRDLDTLLNAIVSCLEQLQCRRFKNASNALKDGASFTSAPQPQLPQHLPGGGDQLGSGELGGPNLLVALEVAGASTQCQGQKTS